jgi:enoyl-CoA hydratase
VQERDDLILYQKDGPIARVTINIPDKNNTLDFMGNGPDAQQFHAALDRAAEDDDVKCVILKGAGHCFCAGERLDPVYKVYGAGDGRTKDERRPSQRIRLRLDRRFEWGFRKIFTHPKVLIAQAHGYSFGIGTHFLLYCDFAIVADDAQLGFIDGRLGSGGTGNPYLGILINTVGLKRALDLVITTRLFSGKDAAQWQMVTKSVPEAELEAEVERYAQTVCLQPADGLAIGKQARLLVMEQLGILQNFTSAIPMHTLFTNLRWEPEERSFIKNRRDGGIGSALSGLHDRYKDLIDEGIRKIPRKKPS